MEEGNKNKSNVVPWLFCSSTIVLIILYFASSESFNSNYGEINSRSISHLESYKTSSKRAVAYETSGVNVLLELSEDTEHSKIDTIVLGSPAEKVKMHKPLHNSAYNGKHLTVGLSSYITQSNVLKYIDLNKTNTFGELKLELSFTSK